MSENTNGRPGVVLGWKGELEPKEVTLIFEGEEHKFTVEPDSTILETGLTLGLDLPYSCQSGLCTTCMGKCHSGKVKLDEVDALTDEDIEQSYTLTCVAHPITDDVVIEIE